MKIGMVQINNRFSNQVYLPYSVGLLQVSAEKYLKDITRDNFLLPIYTRIPVEAAVHQLLPADIVFFSTYVWNIRLSLEIAKQLKLANPDCLTVFGGPQVPDNSEEFLRQHPFIDLGCHGEGEAIIGHILENSKERSWEGIPSVTFIRSNGTFLQNPRAPRRRNLFEIPSPYLEGAFDDLIQENPQEKWLVLWETNRGCPFACTFCDWGSAVQSRVNSFDLERLQREVDWFKDNQIEFIFCCDANYGILRRDYEITKYVVDTKNKYGYPKALSVQNTKNSTDSVFQIQKILAEAGLNKGVTLSMQSMDENTLKYVKRDNIALDAYRELQQKFTAANIETYSDMILGMPGETYDSFLDGVSTLIEHGQHNRIQFANLSILPNAEMADPEYQKRFGMICAECKIVNIHGSLDEEEIFETQQLVVETNSMPEKDWVRTRAFCWMAALLYFDKLLQIPILIVHKVGGLSAREILESLYAVETESYPILSEINAFFLERARDIQNGGAEYCLSKEWLNIWWPADEFIFIKMCMEGKLQAFYDEAELILKRLLEERFVSLPPVLLREAIMLNRKLIKFPFQTEDMSIDLSFNVWDFYQEALRGFEIPIDEEQCTYRIDRTSEIWPSWDQWFQEVVWYGNKKGAYLYKLYPAERRSVLWPQSGPEAQIAGHF